MASDVDKKKLTAWLREREGHRNDVLASVYAGLRQRVERGDFDAPEHTNGGL